MPDAPQLARRVGWLDRYRRVIAIGSALVLTPIASGHLGDALEWPHYGWLAGAMIGLVAWVAIEVGLACVTAFWEVQCVRLLGERGLPRAIAVPRKRAASRRMHEALDRPGA
jgi:hypothetical protein